MNDLTLITQLQTLQRQKQQLAADEASLLTPLLTDFSDIQSVYELFKTIMASRNPEQKADQVMQRKKFIFIALCFFAPGTLAGYRLPHGFRAALAKVLDTYPTFISDNIENVIFQYQKIKAFREELQYLYSEIAKQLERLGKIDTLPQKSI